MIPSKSSKAYQRTNCISTMFVLGENIHNHMVWKSLAIMCNNAEQTVKKKSKVASLDFCRTKIYSKFKCANKVMPIAEGIMHDNWTKRYSYKSLKITSSTWLVTFDFESEKSKESLTLYELPKFKRVCWEQIWNWLLSCTPYHI